MLTLDRPLPSTRRFTVTEPSRIESAFSRRLRDGDEAAFTALIHTYGRRMLAVAHRMLDDEHEAQEAVQDACLSAFRSRDAFRGDSRPWTWLYRITVNAALMLRRRRRARPSRSFTDLLPAFAEDGAMLDVPAPIETTAADVAASAELRALVRAKIDELPDRYRQVVSMRDLAELDTADVAQMLGISRNAVKVRLHRARQALRTLLSEQLG